MSNAFIITFKDSVTKDEVKEYLNYVNNNGGEVTNDFINLLNGFSFKAPNPDLFLNHFKSIEGDIIESIEADQVITVNPIPASAE